MPISIDIIILSYAKDENLKQLTDNAVKSLIQSESSDEIKFCIIVIESNKELIPYQYPHTKTIYPKQKFGFHRYMNLGIRRTNSQYICLCNNDIYFHSGWASEIIKSFIEDNNLMSASPMCSNLHPTMGIFKNSGIYYGYSIRRELAGWCIFFKRDILQIIGMLDPNYRFWFADNDYAMTLQKYSLKHALITTSVVDHLQSRTLKTKPIIEQYKLTYFERFYFEYKWGYRSYNSYRYFRKKYHGIINLMSEDDFIDP